MSTDTTDPTETADTPHQPADTGAPTPRPQPRSAPPIGARIHTLNRPNMVSVGTIVWLASELMFFAGLFAVYFTVRAQVVGEWPPPPTELNLTYALVFTIVLIVSSFTCQLGVFAAERGDVFALRRWFGLTLLLGLVFVLGQANEYRVLVLEHATTVSSSTYGTVFYLTTGFHGLHVLGGLIAMLFVLGRSFVSHKFGSLEATTAIVVSYYWHFVDVVWVALFLVIYGLR